jgi:hypothetical protein
VTKSPLFVQSIVPAEELKNKKNSINRDVCIFFLTFFNTT